MEAIISSFRMARHHQYDRQMILIVEGMDSEKAKTLVGKEVVWKSPSGKEIKGKVSALHGRKGAVRAIFETGMPGQALTTKVEIK